MPFAEAVCVGRPYTEHTAVREVVMRVRQVVVSMDRPGHQWVVVSAGAVSLKGIVFQAVALQVLAVVTRVDQGKYAGKPGKLSS